MPTLNLFTNIPVDVVLSSDILKDATKAVAKIIGKPESVSWPLYSYPATLSCIHFISILIKWACQCVSCSFPTFALVLHYLFANTFYLSIAFTLVLTLSMLDFYFLISSNASSNPEI